MMPGSSHGAAGSSTEHALSSSLRSDEECAIFLSHSGWQKPFVENLFETLRRANHTAFFDQHTLPKGSCFPHRILTAALGCKLGVVVLSEEYLTSKWPMLELEILVKQRGPKAMVLPLYYKLHPEDLKSPENLSRWRQVWEEKAGSRDAAVKWGEAVRALNAFNGEKFGQGMTEALYIKRVVHSICKAVPSSLPFDLSPIKGRHRLAKEVAEQFDCTSKAGRGEEACIMVGLHGLGGLGKSTMSKVMVNFYSSRYPGRSYHLKLPTDGNMSEIVQGCKNALRRLANLDELLLSKVEDFDEVIELMRVHLSQYDVFLAIDNIWERSGGLVQRILGVGFSAESKILLTSRSEQVLWDLFRGHNNTCVGPLPALEDEEAFQIIEDASQLHELNALETTRGSLLTLCMFNGTYHPLALRALGRHVKSECGRRDVLNEDDLLHILEEIRNVDLLSVEDVFGLRYKDLAEHKKHMFLDIALLKSVRRGVYNGNELTYAKAQQWLSCLYQDQVPKTQISRMIDELVLDGFVQLETGLDAKGLLGVHDLLYEFAKREAVTSSRFFIAGSSDKLVKQIDWQQLARVILTGEKDQCPAPQEFIEGLQQQECRMLQVVEAKGVDFQKGIDLHFMPSLRVMMLKNVSLRSIQNWSAASGLAILWLSNVRPAQPSESSSRFRFLRRTPTRVLDLKGLSQLQMLCLRRSCHAVERIEGLDTLIKNGGYLDIGGCWGLRMDFWSRSRVYFHNMFLLMPVTLCECDL